MTRFFLVRHGETVWNRERKYQGQSDIPLTDEGRIQAEKLSERLKNEEIDIIYSSNLKRAVETAEIIAVNHESEVRPTPLMRELNFGVWEGMTFEQVTQSWPQEYEEWRCDPHNQKPLKGNHFPNFMNEFHNS